MDDAAGAILGWQVSVQLILRHILQGIFFTSVRKISKPMKKLYSHHICSHSLDLH